MGIKQAKIATVYRGLFILSERGVRVEFSHLPQAFWLVVGMSLSLCLSSSSIKQDAVQKNLKWFRGQSSDKDKI